MDVVVDCAVVNVVAIVRHFLVAVVLVALRQVVLIPVATAVVRKLHRLVVEATYDVAPQVLAHLLLFLLLDASNKPLSDSNYVRGLVVPASLSPRLPYLVCPVLFAVYPTLGVSYTFFRAL